jgi:hypothetical protein
MLAMACAAFAQATPTTLSDAVETFAREKSLAEEVARLLKENAANQPDKLAQGVLLYAEAEASFNGLIERLLLDLAAPTSPADSAAFHDRLAKAVDARVQFTRYVGEQVLPPAQSGTKGPLADILKGAGSLIKSLTDAGIAIWREYRSAATTRRDEIQRSLQRQRWPAWGDIK